MDFSCDGENLMDTHEVAAVIMNCMIWNFCNPDVCIPCDCSGMFCVYFNIRKSADKYKS